MKILPTDLSKPAITQADIDALRAAQANRDRLSLGVLCGFLTVPLSVAIGYECLRLLTSEVLPYALFLSVLAWLAVLVGLHGWLRAHDISRLLAPVPEEWSNSLNGYCNSTPAAYSYAAQVRAQGRQFIWAEFEALFHEATRPDWKVRYQVVPDEV